METLALIQLLSQLLPTLVNILIHYEELAKNASEQDKEKMKIYLDSLSWKDWADLKKEVENSSTGASNVS